MARTMTALPNWSWDEVEAALRRLSPTSATEEVLESLLVEIQARQARLSREDLLHELLCLGWIMAQARVSAIAHHPPVSFASSSSPPWPS